MFWRRKKRADAHESRAETHGARPIDMQLFGDAVEMADALTTIVNEWQTYRNLRPRIDAAEEVVRRARETLERWKP